MLVTLHHGLQLMLSKTIRIADTKYDIQYSIQCWGDVSVLHYVW